MNAKEKAQALTSPSGIFKHPGDVVARSDLSRTEKTAILKQWELDARLMQLATEEGMGEGEPSLLAEVRAAQKILAVAPLAEVGVPTKLGL